MNREIKFRAWSGNKMFYSFTMFDGKVWNSIQDEPIDWPIMQFTGLTDKNGKEIYEGDILLHTGTNQCDLEVHFKEGAFWGKGMFTDCVMDMFLKSYDFQSVEVIGNIHENPELLSTEPKDTKE